MGFAEPTLQDAPTSAELLAAKLETELAGSSIELPSFPQVAIRVRELLADDDISIDEVVRVVSAEPALSVRLLQLGNSAALNPNGKRITTLRVAIARVGFNMARSATIAFAMSQMRRADAWRGLESRFGALWDASANLAARSHVIAKHAGRLNAEMALLAGMLHAIGKLYVLTRASRFPSLLNDAAAFAEFESAWHARAARALLANWNLAPEVIDAACDHERVDVTREGVADLRDVLYAAHRLTPGVSQDVAAITGSGVFRRLGMDAAACAAVLESSSDEIASLKAALAD